MQRMIAVFCALWHPDRFQNSVFFDRTRALTSSTARRWSNTWRLSRIARTPRRWRTAGCALIAW